MANFLNDTFTEAAATNITSHTPEVGGTWALHTGYATVMPVVGAGTGRVTFNPGAYAIVGKVSDAPPSADYSVSVTGKIAAATNLFGVVARLQPTGFTCIAGFIGDSGKAYIWRYGGAGTGAIFTTAYAVTLNQDYEVSLSLSGTSVTLRVNGVVVGTVTEASVTAAGSAGFIGIGDVSLTSIAAGDVIAADSLTQTEQITNKNYQRSGTSATVPFSGTYAGTVPTSIEVKIVTTAGATVQDWTALTGETISGGNWSGSLSVTQGGMYNFLSRSKSGSTVLLTSSQSANPFGVGAIFTVVGQSNGNKMFSVGSGTPLATVSAYNGATLTGAGAISLANALSTALSIPVTLINTAVDGAGLCTSTASASGSWDNTSGSLYTNWQSKVTAAGGKLEGVFWLQGEWDGGQNVAKALYKSTLQTLIASMRSHTGQASLPFFIAPLTRYTGGTFAGWDNVQDAFLEVLTATIIKTCDTWDLSSSDGLHYDATGQTTLGSRLALAVRKYLGQSVESLGPYVAGVLVNGTTVDVTFAHLSGSDITPASGITGLTFTANGAAVTPTSVIRQAANKVRATFATAPALPVYAAVAVGTNPDASAPLKDNTGLPAQRTATAGVLAAAKTATIRLVDEDTGAPLASLSGIRWAWYDSTTPDGHAAPTDKGTGETTDASGYLQVLINNSALSSGGIGSLEISTSDGTTTQSPSPRGWAGPVAVD